MSEDSNMSTLGNDSNRKPQQEKNPANKNVNNKKNIEQSKSSKRQKVGSLFQKSFLLMDELGRGAYGFVYRCVNRRNKRVYAVKFNINPSDMSGMKDEYYMSAEICHPTGHPNIVNVLGSISDDMIVYNIYELACGGDLGSDLELKGCFSEELVTDIIRQVLLGVEYIHMRGFLHRDLKPQNLLILKNTYFHIKVTDFGLAIRRKKKSLDTFVAFEHGYAGTESYICPEILRNAAYDYECDVWSVGVILYELVAGYVPFEDFTPLESTHEFLYPEWRGMDKAADLINKIFDRTKKNASTMTVKEALDHPFLAGHALSRQLKPNLSNAMTHYLGMKRLKQEFMKLRKVSVL